MIDILIITDNRYREQFSSELLSSYLKKDFIVRVVSKNIFRTAIQLLKPQAVIIPRVTHDFQDIFEFKEKYKFKVFFLPVEHAAQIEDAVKSFMETYLKKNDSDKTHSEKLKKNVTKIFVPGEFYKNIILKHNLFNEAQIVITGTQNSDLWFKDINQLFKKNKKFKKTIGIATSFKSFLFGSDFKSIQNSIQVISNYTTNLIKNKNNYQIDIKKLKRGIYFAWNEMFQFMIINKIINDNKHLNFSIRAHPMEHIKNIKSYERVTKNLNVDRDIILNEWILKQKIILSFGSTVLYDSYFSGVQSYSLRKFVPDHIFDLLDEQYRPAYSEFPFQPNTYDELYKILNLDDVNNSQYFTESVETKIYQTSIPSFNYPRKEKTYKIISDEIKKILRLKQRSFIDKILVCYYSFVIFLKQVKVSNFSLDHRYVISDKLYNPLSFFKNFKLRKYIRNIIN